MKIIEDIDAVYVVEDSCRECDDWCLGGRIKPIATFRPYPATGRLPEGDAYRQACREAEEFVKRFSKQRSGTAKGDSK